MRPPQGTSIIFKNISVIPIASKSTAQIFAKFSGVVELRMQMVNVKWVFRSVCANCIGALSIAIYVDDWQQNANEDDGKD